MFRELRVLKSLQPHPNVIALLGCCTTRGKYPYNDYMVYTLLNSSGFALLGCCTTRGKYPYDDYTVYTLLTNLGLGRSFLSKTVIGEHFSSD